MVMSNHFSMATVRLEKNQTIDDPTFDFNQVKLMKFSHVLVNPIFKRTWDVWVARPPPRMPVGSMKVYKVRDSRA